MEWLASTWSRMPTPLVRLACGSTSTRRTRRSARASDAPRLMAVVVLPTPPFWLATAIILPIFNYLQPLSGPKSRASGSADRREPLFQAIDRVSGFSLKSSGGRGDVPRGTPAHVEGAESRRATFHVERHAVAARGGGPISRFFRTRSRLCIESTSGYTPRDTRSGVALDSTAPPAGPRNRRHCPPGFRNACRLDQHARLHPHRPHRQASNASCNSGRASSIS